MTPLAPGLFKPKRCGNSDGPWPMAVRESTTSSSEPSSTLSSTLARKIGTSGRRILIDTSVLVDLKKHELLQLSPRLATSTLTIAELSSGPSAALDGLEQKRRMRHLRCAEAKVEILSFDSACARAYGLISAGVEQIGRKPRGARAVDLMIAATALAYQLPLCTLNLDDLRGVEHLIEIVDVNP